jgi:hypothetical protein
MMYSSRGKVESSLHDILAGHIWEVTLAKTYPDHKSEGRTTKDQERKPAAEYETKGGK